jgi:hypothetical protein
MTNDELLSGFLDRSLSEDQLLEFEARRASDPSFAAEVNDMVTVENLLADSSPTIETPVGFLSTVEASVVAKIAAGAAGTVGLAHLFSNAWAWVIGTGAVVVGAGGVYLATNNQNPANTTPVKVRQGGSQQVSPVPPQQQVTSPTAEPTQPAPAQPQPPATTSNSTAPAPIRNNSSSTADLNAQSPESVLDNLTRQLETCQAQGNSVKCAQLAIQLGREYRKRGHETNATRYLELGLAEARKARTVQQQVQALSELARVARDVNNGTLARQRYQEAIKLASSAGLPTSDLESELNSLP